MKVARHLRSTAAVLACIGLAAAEQPELPERAGIFPQELRTFHTEAEGLVSNNVFAVAIAKDGRVYARTAEGDTVFRDGKWFATRDASTIIAAKMEVPSELRDLVKAAGRVLAVASGPEGNGEH